MGDVDVVVWCVYFGFGLLEVIGDRGYLCFYFVYFVGCFVEFVFDGEYVG